MASFMDHCFLNARLPSFLMIDENHLSLTSQSYIVEITTWVKLYLIYASIMQYCVRSVLSKYTKFWNDGKITKRSGVFCANAQDDSVVMMVMGVHHFTAGMMCLLGIMNDDPNMFRHGYLLEVGFEIADVLSMIFKLYPFALDNIKSDVQCALVFHHLSGILFSGVFLNAGFIHNEHFRIIAFVLLGGAAVSALSGFYINTLDLEKDLHKLTLLCIGSALFWCYCRFYIFPMESYSLLQQVWVNPELSGTWTVTFLYFSFAFYTMFSFGITIDFVAKCIRLVKRCLGEDIALDLEEVPPSREERMKMMEKSSTVRQRSRKSSLSTDKLRKAIMNVDAATNSDGFPRVVVIRKTVRSLKNRSKQL